MLIAWLFCGCPEQVGPDSDPAGQPWSGPTAAAEDLHDDTRGRSPWCIMSVVH